MQSCISPSDTVSYFLNAFHDLQPLVDLIDRLDILIDVGGKLDGVHSVWRYGSSSVSYTDAIGHPALEVSAWGGVLPMSAASIAASR